MTRPNPPSGHAYRAAPATNWRTTNLGLCRQMSGTPPKTCRQLAVAELNRGRRRGGGHGYRDQWWRYCADHLAAYGCWISDDTVMCWQAANSEAAS